MTPSAPSPPLLVGSVAERREAGASAPAQRNGGSPLAAEVPAVAVDEARRATDEQGSAWTHSDENVWAQRRDGGIGGVGHVHSVPGCSPTCTPEVATAMPVPAARGPLSAELRAVLVQHTPTTTFLEAVRTAGKPADVLHDDDVQITLTMLYELHLQGLVGVSDDWEWDTDLLAARAVLEAWLAAALDALAGDVACTPDTMAGDLAALTADDGTPGLARFVARQAQLWQVQEIVVHRSLYQLREADPHTLGIPRLAGAPKAALVEVQADEYGGGRPERMHSALFARTMTALGVDSSYAAHVDRVPAITLASLNALSYLALHRSRLGELVGHLCAVEMTSSAPSKLYSTGLRRLGFDRDATRFYDEHVEADAMHEQIVARDLAGGLASAQPHRAPDVLRGARICAALDDLVGTHITTSWAEERSSLLA